jgi:hypothetical protein
VGLTRTQVDSWDPKGLDDLAKNWLMLAEKIDSAFSRYRSAVTDVHGVDWQGVTADAALARAESDRHSAIRVVLHLEGLASIAKGGYHTIDAPLQRTRDTIRAAEEAGFYVGEDLSVWIPGWVPEEEAEAKEPDVAHWEAVIAEAAAETERADAEVTRALLATQEDLLVTIVAPAALGSDQAKDDVEQLWKRLLNDPSPLAAGQLQRLIEA